MIPPKSDPKWREIVISKEAHNFSALPTKLLVMRIRLLARDGTQQKIDEAIDIAYDFFSKNSLVVKSDIELLFSKQSKG